MQILNKLLLYSLLFFIGFTCAIFYKKSPSNVLLPDTDIESKLKTKSFDFQDHHKFFLGIEKDLYIVHGSFDQSGALHLSWFQRGPNYTEVYQWSSDSPNNLSKDKLDIPNFHFLSP
jgi:hypothetical protein